MFAASAGYFDVVVTLLSVKGIDVNVENFEQKTAIKLAYNKKHLAIVNILLQNGGVLSAKSKINFDRRLAALYEKKTARENFKPNNIEVVFSPTVIFHFNPQRSLTENITTDLGELQVSETERSSLEHKIEDFLNTITEKYAQSMANPAEKLWGGDVEIQLLGKLKNLKIHVHHANMCRDPDILGVDNTKRTIHLLYSDGNHYDVCNAKRRITHHTVPDGNCLFEAVICAEIELTKTKILISPSTLNAKIDALRKEIAEVLLKNSLEIKNGTAFHRPMGFKGAPVKLKQSDDVVWVRFKAVFEAENNDQLHFALSLLPDGTLKTEAKTLKRELDRLVAKESLEKIASPLAIRKK
jgi:hypothetical protein